MIQESLFWKCVQQEETVLLGESDEIYEIHLFLNVGQRGGEERRVESREYEGENSITYSCLILMQPLGADQATVAHMEAVNVPFQ